MAAGAVGAAGAVLAVGALRAVRSAAVDVGLGTILDAVRARCRRDRRHTHTALAELIRATRVPAGSTVVRVVGEVDAVAVANRPRLRAAAALVRVPAAVHVLQTSPGAQQPVPHARWPGLHLRFFFDAAPRALIGSASVAAASTPPSRAISCRRGIGPSRALVPVGPADSRRSRGRACHGRLGTALAHADTTPQNGAGLDPRRSAARAGEGCARLALMAPVSDLPSSSGCSSGLGTRPRAARAASGNSRRRCLRRRTAPPRGRAKKPQRSRVGRCRAAVAWARSRSQPPRPLAAAGGPATASAATPVRPPSAAPASLTAEVVSPHFVVHYAPDPTDPNAISLTQANSGRHDRGARVRGRDGSLGSRRPSTGRRRPRRRLHLRRPEPELRPGWRTATSAPTPPRRGSRSTRTAQRDHQRHDDPA